MDRSGDFDYAAPVTWEQSVAVHRKYQVFISSTQRDLVEIRKEVTFEVMAARQIPVGMEIFPATHDRGWETIQRFLDTTDYYVVISAGMYGSLYPGEEVSWTEKEYDYALERGISVLVFIRSKSHINLDEVDEHAEKLAAFHQRLQAHGVKWWTDEKDLCRQVAQALQNHIYYDEADKKAPPGWIRGDAVPADALAELTRLSAENAQLRSQVEKLAGKKADLHVTLACEGVEAEDGGLLECTRPLYTGEPAPEPYPASFSLGRGNDWEAEAEKRSKMLVFGLGLENRGEAAVEALTVKIRVSPVSWVERREEPDALLTGRYIPDPALLPTNAVYVDYCEEEDGTAYVTQKVSLIVPDDGEGLWPFRCGFEPDAEGVIRAEVQVKVRAKCGAQVDVTFQLVCTPSGEVIQLPEPAEGDQESTW